MIRNSTLRRAPHSDWPHDPRVLLACAFFGALLGVAPLGARVHRDPNPAPDVREVSAEKSGQIATRPGLRLSLRTDVGNVHIFTDATNEIVYRVRVASDASQAGAAELVQRYAVTAQSTAAGAQITGAAPANAPDDALWIDYEIHVPLRYNLEIVTHGGNIETQDIDGRVSLSTGGGNVTAGRVGPAWQASGAPARTGENYSARLETQGGYIAIGDVAGDLRASTAGGQISIGNVRGQAVMHTGGGHIRAGAIAGGELDTEGGNIIVERSTAGLTATTAGGQISLGEISGGPLRARTDGGAIRIARVAGASEIETGDGNIALSCAEGPLHASTSAGSIMAWFLDQNSNDEPANDGAIRPALAPRARRDASPSQLESGVGDIVVYLPRALPLTIDATIDQNSGYQIIADPLLAMKVDQQGGTGGTLRAQCELNGGGEVLRLKADSGNIVLKYGDPAAAMRYTQGQMDQLRGQVGTQVEALLDGGTVEQFVGQSEQANLASFQQQEQIAQQQEQAALQEESSFERFAMRLEQMWWGQVRVDPDEQQKKLLARVTPDYPDVARQAGLEGTVVLRVEIGPDGSVENIDAVSGSPLLARAAAQAVAQWRYAPTIVDGNPVSVITSVSVEFHLNQR